MNFITLHNVSRTFSSKHRTLRALSKISLDVRQNEFLSIVGPSGSGKSTLLRIMAGLDREHSGQVTYSEAISRAEVSFVFQHFALLPWLTIFENIEIGVLARGLATTERKRFVNRELRRFGLAAFAQAYPKDLSGGMQQRVGLARALVNQPKIIFMDEPFSELDSFTASELRQELLRVWQEQHLTIVMITHITAEAIELADRIAVLTARPGKLEETVINRMPRPRSLRSKESFALEDRIMQLVRP